MSESTTPQRLAAAPVSIPGSPPLDLHEIQGDVLIGLQKNFERFIFFKITEVAPFKSALRKKIGHRITSTLTVKAREFQLRDYKKGGGKEPLPLIGLNLGFTNTGIKKLIQGADLGDTSFEKGAVSLAPTLGDALDGTGKPANWKPSQFEFLQISWANNPTFISPTPLAKNHPDGSPITVGFDPIIGQNTNQKGQPQPRISDEPVPNYPTGNQRSTLNEPQNFIVPTGGAYFFVPSIAALENELSA
jgi:hypothetical protein